MFSPGSGALDGDEFEVVTAASFFVSAFESTFVLAGLLTTGAGVAPLPAADGAATALDDEAGSGSVAAADGTAVDLPGVDGATDVVGGTEVESVAASGDVD